MTKCQSKIEAIYGTNGESISDIVGIVTPFAAQSRKIKSNLPFRDMVVGTVHSLQGAEREIIIFSTVYTPKDRCARMLDEKPNLINVAVSRAKKSFIVFGDTNLLKLQQSSSGILGRHIMKSEYNLKNIKEWC